MSTTTCIFYIEADDLSLCPCVCMTSTFYQLNLFNPSAHNDIYKWISNVKLNYKLGVLKYSLGQAWQQGVCLKCLQKVIPRFIISMPILPVIWNGHIKQLI